MLRKAFLIFITLANLIILYLSQFFGGFIPFYIEISCYVSSCIVVLIADRLESAVGNSLSHKIKNLLKKGKSAYYLTFLAVIDNICFVFVIPDTSLNLLEQTYQLSYIFYAMIIFFIPIMLIKFALEPNGKEIENIFWSEYLQQIKIKKPSMDFALFILARLQLKSDPLQKQQPVTEQQFEQVDQLSDQIATTTFPINYGQKPESIESNDQSKNSLFDSPETLAKENIFEKYFQEIYQLMPELEQLSNSNPVRLRPELFLNIIIERSFRDPQMIQFFKDCT